MPALPDSDALSIEVVRESPHFKDFSAAYRRLTGMCLNLAPASPMESRICFACEGKESTFCSMVTSRPEGAEACLKVQEAGRMRAHQHRMPAIARCFSGLIDVFVPVTVHGRHVATLVTGQVSQRKLNSKDVKVVDELLKKWKFRAERPGIHRALLGARIVDYVGVDASIEILKLFADQLSARWEQIVTRPRTKISNAVQKGLDIVRERFTDPKLDMKTASRLIGLNHFYFCKIFKKEMGVGFLEFLNRERVNQAQKLLGNPDVRVKEIGFKSGFQSLATFNRVFKKHTGVTPSDYRKTIFSTAPGR